MRKKNNMLKSAILYNAELKIKVNFILKLVISVGIFYHVTAKGRL